MSDPSPEDKGPEEELTREDIRHLIEAQKKEVQLEREKQETRRMDASARTAKRNGHSKPNWRIANRPASFSSKKTSESRSMAW